MQYTTKWMQTNSWLVNTLVNLQQACGFSGFCTNLPLPQHFLERREVATKERKKEVGSVVSKPASFLFVGMWKVCINPTKLYIQEIRSYIRQTVLIMDYATDMDTGLSEKSL